MQFQRTNGKDRSMSVTLTSKYASLRYIVKNTETILDPQRGPVVTSPPVIVKFANYSATVNDDVWDVIKDTYAYTGIDGEKMIWRIDDEGAPLVGGGTAVNIRSGMAVGNATPQKNAPLDGWDQMTVSDIQQAIKAGRIADASEAIEYESRKGGRRRSTVIKALASMLDARVDDEAKASTGDTFSAPKPGSSD
jgi:hypothetical protein